jgi:uncharacterized protein YllA (UPF0747 family)
MPVVVPRASITLVETPVQRLLGKYHLSIDDVFAGRQHLRAKMAARFFSEDLTTRFRETTESLERQMAGILERKAAAAVQSKSDQVERDAVRLENAIYPEKAMQERIYCGPSLLARFGMGLVEQLHQAIPAVPVDHQVLTDL